MQERIRSLEGLIQRTPDEAVTIPVLHARMATPIPMVIDKVMDGSHRDATPTVNIDHGPTASPPQDVNVIEPEDMIVVDQGQQSNITPEVVVVPEWPIDPPGTTTIFDSGHIGREPEIPDLPTVPPTANVSPQLANSYTVTTEAAPPMRDITMSNFEERQPRALQDKGAQDVAFYGGTTQLQVQAPEIKDPAVRPTGDFEHETALNMDSAQLRKALFRIFFKIQPNSQVIVREDLFMRDRDKGGRHRYYSSFLENSLLAAATRNSTSSAVRKLGKKYAERAKSQICSELEQQNIASLQGFLLLSDFEATRGRARLGWTYSSEFNVVAAVTACLNLTIADIATGVLVDLALHVEHSAAVKEQNMTQDDAEFRDSILLGTFVYATLWSLYLGRPNSISSPVVAAVRRVVEYGTCTTTLQMWVTLSLQMMDIIEILNSTTSLRSPERGSKLRLCSLEINLRSVFDNLPPELAFDEQRIDELDAEAYGPHMQYFGIQVTLHRAMIKGTNFAPAIRDDIVQPKSLDHLYAVVHENAMRIARLILSYRRIFGLENIITVMLDNVYVAAIALTSHIIRMQQLARPFDSEIRWLRSLYEVLEAVEKHYPVTTRMRSSLIHFIRQTPLVKFFPEKVPTTSPSSVPEIVPGVSAGLAPVNLTFQAPLNPASPTNGDELPILDFTLTTEDDWWLHDSAWNMTTLAFDS
ncbi:hypothetical protein LTR10_023038 [Elasticomyces elasticus]|uniref:Xylanolytic transcriptional activator regulatory domain-containing protein n=1 Tax=Exophiala sideris TaxID=1016849 RepID=A0ABR0IW39_9EURO|nr:hypothetical protein LTR10_023038 [Elasticomyces elasticus]KAK5021040.1 hypothetical protein LTS07_011295 [Exophiala sideris]KAK5023319.1 hypothetical protein LTR13_011231 [Exophiala sideris]KAK5048766.1 hypothetical protein LTR69_011312 [Exophiala sideris]KAK5176170.1 hypothetical protein LTR44_011265 [Eurotiomycetes sp. CCFEE 6388]